MAYPDREPHILVADDDAEFRSMVAWALGAEGYSVTEFADGLQLMAKIFVTDPGDFDLIISDVRMPKGGGLEILKGMLNLKKCPPLILMTSFGDRQTHDRAMQMGALAFFDKPFDIKALVEQVKGIVPAACWRKNEGARIHSNPVTMISQQRSVATCATVAFCHTVGGC